MKGHDYDTLVEAINDLQRKGYTEDFNIHSNCIRCTQKENEVELRPDDFVVDEVYRFEGDSNPGDNTVIYAISSKEGLKGLIVDAYGTYADSLSEAMIEKLRIKH
jgi:hypothetical protein